MSVMRDNFHRIRMPLILLMIALALSAGAIYEAWRYHQRTLAERDSAVTITTDAEAKAQTAVADRANVDAYRPTYLKLRERHIIGEEQRLPWVEYFTRVAIAGTPSELELTIEPIRTLEDPPTTSEPLENLQFNASKLTLHSKILHELDALRMLAEIKQMQGASIIRRCSMKRAPDGASKAQPYLLEFNCEGDIITLDKPATPAGTPQ